MITIFLFFFKNSCLKTARCNETFLVIYMRRFFNIWKYLQVEFFAPSLFVYPWFTYRRRHCWWTLHFTKIQFFFHPIIIAFFFKIWKKNNSKLFVQNENIWGISLFGEYEHKHQIYDTTIFVQIHTLVWGENIEYFRSLT